MSNIKEVVSDRLGERYFEIEHDSGLKMIVYPKENYASSYVIFGTRYGSIDTAFRLNDDREFTCVPEGIAHFLEHKLTFLFEGQMFVGKHTDRYSKRLCTHVSCHVKYQRLERHYERQLRHHTFKRTDNA